MKKLLSILLCFLLLSTGSVVSQTTLLQYTYQVVMAGQTSVGTQSANIVLSGSSFHQLTWTVSGTVATCSVKVDSSADGVSWNNGDIIGAQTCTTNGTINSSSFVANFVRINLVTLSGAGATFNAVLDGFSQNPAGGGGGAVSSVFTRTGAVIAVSGDYNLSQISSGAIASGSTATTQAANDNSTKVATTAYADRVNANPLFTGNSASNTTRVTSNFTTSSASQTNITGLSFTLPANVAANYKLDCSIFGVEATSATALSFDIQDVTVAPTGGSLAYYGAMTAGTTIQTKTTITYNSTSQTLLMSFTPSGSGVNFWGRVVGIIEQPSNVSSSQLVLSVGVTGGTNVLTIFQDSSCTISTAAN